MHKYMRSLSCDICDKTGGKYAISEELTTMATQIQSLDSSNM
jgi:hypothetical protein